MERLAETTNRNDTKKKNKQKKPKQKKKRTIQGLMEFLKLGKVGFVGLRGGQEPPCLPTLKPPNHRHSKDSPPDH